MFDRASVEDIIFKVKLSQNKGVGGVIYAESYKLL